jgi:hypothetical protein
MNIALIFLGASTDRHTASTAEWLGECAGDAVSVASAESGRLARLRLAAAETDADFGKMTLSFSTASCERR